MPGTSASGVGGSTGKFLRRASKATKIVAYVLGVLLVTLAGVATARARDQYFKIGAEASPAAP